MAKPVPPRVRFFMQHWLFIVSGLIALVVLWMFFFKQIDADKFIGIITALTALVAVLKTKT